MYTSDKIRNVAILGHLGCGKTTLTEACYSVTNGIKANAKATVEKKNTVSDYMVEEQQRLSSVSNGIVPVFHEGYKINFIDVPGNDDFIGEAVAAINVCDGAIVVIDAASGIEVGTVKHFNMLKKAGIPTFLFVNKMDKENVDFSKLLKSIEQTFGKNAVAFELPVGSADKFEGYIDVVELKGRKFNGEAVTDYELTGNEDDVETQRAILNEAVAETSEELMEKFLMEEEFTLDEFKTGLKVAVAADDICPILVGCATKSIGVKSLLSMIEAFVPAPTERKAVAAKDEDDKAITLKCDSNASFAGIVFKTTVDQYSGTCNYFKVVSGSIKSGDDVYCPQTGNQEKVAALFTPCGKKQMDADTICAGDIAGIAKLTDVKSSMTLCSPKAPVVLNEIPFPTPVFFRAFKTTKKADEDKIGAAIKRIITEDPTIVNTRNSETRQQLLGGQGTGHLNYVFDRLKNSFKVEVETEDPKIVYRETVKGSVTTTGNYKKQSGGSGHYGVVVMKWEKNPESAEENVFAEEVFGGAVPKNFFPAVEKGFNLSLEAGLLAGFPVIGVKATLLDGKYHPVDSDEISFVNAAKLSYKEAYAVDKFGKGNKMQLKPTILEPIMKVVINASPDYTGDILSDINTRRARIISMDDGELVASVPEAELIDYANVLKAITKSSGSFTREFQSYEEVPSFLIDKVIADNKITREEEE